MAKSPEPFKVFYSWQSDMPHDHCRHLIRKALDMAAEVLNADDSLNHQVYIDQDIQNETGLCDIPAVILRKLADADAVVSDLTFIAKSEPSTGGKVKHCSNPNVLFELGYAFHAVGPERLLCVMNEKHGSRSSQIFDLAHRNQQITYISPGDVSDEKIVNKLRDDLVNALHPIISKGLRTYSGELSAIHESERSEIESYSLSEIPTRGNSAILSLHLHPESYRERRWPMVDQLESLIRKRATHDGYHEFPPQQRGTSYMSWGLYNSMYGERWALTYAGQFWFHEQVSVAGQGPEVPQYRPYGTELPTTTHFEADTWISFISIIKRIHQLAGLAISLSHEFFDNEIIVIDLSVNNIRRKWLLFNSGSYFLRDEPMGPCASPSFHPPTVRLAAKDMREQLPHIAIDWMKELCDMFSRDGRRIQPDTLRDWCLKIDGREA